MMNAKISLTVAISDLQPNFQKEYIEDLLKEAKDYLFMQIDNKQISIQRNSDNKYESFGFENSRGTSLITQMHIIGEI